MKLLDLRPILDEAFEVFGDKSEYVVAVPQYRAAANTAMGWKNVRNRTTHKFSRKSGVPKWGGAKSDGRRKTLRALPLACARCDSLLYTKPFARSSTHYRVIYSLTSKRFTRSFRIRGGESIRRVESTAQIQPFKSEICSHRLGRFLQRRHRCSFACIQ